MEAEIAQLTEMNKNIQCEVNDLTSKHKNLVASMTLSEAKRKLSSTSEEVPHIVHYHQLHISDKTGCV